jgi:DTW domain-containing protein YfiP
MDSIETNDLAPRRAICPGCALPRSTCVCALVERVANRVDVLVLQHPREGREAKGSARLLRLGLARCEVLVGEVFEPTELARRLHGDGRRSVLLYPDDAAAVDPAHDPATGATRLVVLDGTWRKSLRMLRANALLQALPRLGLHPVSASRYGLLRKARVASQLSTLEATCAALARLEGEGARYEPMLRSFDRFVDDRAARRPPR